MEDVVMKLIEMSISASWLVLVVLVLRLLLKKSPRWIHVCLWALVALRLVFPVSIETPVSLTPTDLTEQVMEALPNSYYGDSMIHSYGTEDYDVAVSAGIQPEEGDNGYLYVVTQPDDPTKPVHTMQMLWDEIWLVGMAAMVVYALVSYIRLKQKVAASIYLDNGVFLCDYIDTPFILGIFRPRIYLPSTMEPDSASHVLAHERAHIARHDHWWKPLGYVLLTVHWFNPVMWLAYVLLCRDIELACDEKVIRQMELPQKKAYSEALLNCSVKRMHIAACPLAFGEVGVKQRVKSVLNYKKPGFWLVLVAVIALIVTAVCFLTDPMQRTDAEAALWIQEYVYEKEEGRREADEVVCIDARNGFALVYCKGMGPTLELYQYETIGNRFAVKSVCSGDYTISGGMSLNHVAVGGKYIYFGTISEYHYNPIADTNTWLNWDYLSFTDENGKTYKQDMTGKEGFLFILDAPMADFQAVDGLSTVVLNQEKFYGQGYSVRICHFVSLGATGSPFGKYYRAIEMDYRDSVPTSYLGILTDNLYLLSEGYSLLSLDAMDWSKATTVARFSKKDLPEDFADLFLKNPELGASLMANNRNAWEYWDTTHTYENDKDGCYLLQQNDGTLYLVTASRWTAQYREGEDKALRLYRLEQVETDDPFAESLSPYQWTLNLRRAHIQLMQITVYDEEGVPHHTVLGESELLRLRQILNAVTEDQISLGKLKNDHVVSCYVQCIGENGWDADLDVNLQYDGSTVRMVFTTAGAERYPEERNKEWIIRSDALNQFLSVYTYKTPDQDPFSDLDNAWNWCKNIRLSYLTEEYLLAEDSESTYLGEITNLQTAELLRILNQLPEAAFEKAEYTEAYDVGVNLFCRNVQNTDTLDPIVDLRLLDGEIYFTITADWQQPHQTWKITSHALQKFMDDLIEGNKTLWQQIPVTGGIGLGNDAHRYVTCDVGGLEMSIPKLDCFRYQVSEDGIRFKPENVEGWILVQYRTEPFSVCGTGLETVDVGYKNDKYTGIEGYYDGNKAWSFISLTMTFGDVAYDAVFLNEETAPWVTEYFYEIGEVIRELSFRVTG